MCLYRNLRESSDIAWLKIGIIIIIKRPQIDISIQQLTTMRKCRKLMTLISGLVGNLIAVFIGG